VTAARRDGLILAAILVLATALRFVGLPGRGEWDDDQGNELLTMLHWVRDGEVPLLGPVSSFGAAHHGVGFFWLLAPSAFLTDANPVAALATVAVVGVAAVAATWWLGRTVGGALAGHVAGLLMAVSPSSIGASTVLWNPDIVAPGAALATAAGWHAWRTRQARWWLPAAGGSLLALHGHMLAIIIVIPLVVLLVADVVRRPRSERRRMLAPVLGSAAIMAVGCAPLLIHELRSDFSETRAIVEYATGPGAYGRMPPPLPIVALPIIAWRIVIWPVSGLFASAPLWGIPAAILVVGALAVAAAGTQGIARQFGRWAAATTVWAVIALTLISPSLALTIPGLPNDQYHAWLDPILFAVIGVAVATLSAAPRALVGRSAAVAMVAACVMLSAVAMPPLSSPDGGWRRAAESAARIRSVTGDQPTAVTGVAKSGGALEFPLRRRGTPIAAPSAAEFLVVSCDPLFEAGVGMRCGGPAEEAIARQMGYNPTRLVDRFADSPRRVVSVFTRH
jgi:4-amino-4-deoxy-L-arabinose transferase-like glycosyltransferase